MAQWRVIALLVAAVTAALLAACASSHGRRHMGPAQTAPMAEQQNQNGPELRKGMTASEVRRAWGEPRDTLAARDDPETQVWTYERRRLRGAVGGSHAARAVVERVVVTLTFKKDVLTYIEEKIL